MDGLPTFLASTGTITLLSLITVWLQKKKKEAERRKVAEQVLSSPDSSWKKVGTVKELTFYPLKSGRGKGISECNFEKYGPSINEPGVFTQKDRMFIVYDEKTKKFATAREYAKLLLINLTAVDENHAKLEVADVSPLIFQLPKNDKNAKIIKCSMWFNEHVVCLDCGPDVSKWFSKYLIGADAGLSLGIFIPESQRNLVNGVWSNHAKHYKAMRDEDAGLFSDLVSYMIMSQSSVDVLSEKMQKTILPLQLRPNIVVEGCEAYAEDDWEWIKIGDNAVIRSVKLCTRCIMTRIDPNTAIPDPKSEILKVLRSYRKLKDPELHKLENYAPAIGVYCGLYRTGVVKLHDDVYVYQP